MNASTNEPPPEPSTPAEPADPRASIRRFCRVGRALSVLAGIVLTLLSVAGLILGIIEFVSAEPAPTKLSLPRDPRDLNAVIEPEQVGKPWKHLHLEIGKNYEWPVPCFQQDNFVTVTRIDPNGKVLGFKESKSPVFSIAPFEVAESVVNTVKDDLTGKPGPEHSVNAQMNLMNALMSQLCPGAAHGRNGTAVFEWRSFISASLLSELVWCVLLIALTVQFYRLFVHCSEGSPLNRSAFRIYRNLLVIYTSILIFGPVSFYLINLMVSGGVAHFVRIPYGGILICVLLFSLYWMMNKVSLLKEEVDATI